MIARTLAIMRKEFIHIVRDPGTLVLIFWIPIIQMVLLGYAARTDIDHVALAVLDADQSNASRELISAYAATCYVSVTVYAQNNADITALLDAGEVRTALIIPTGLGESIIRGDPVQVGFIVDGSDPTVAASALAAAFQTGQAK